MVKIERGKTIFESSAQTLVNTINCVGVMGKGLALEFKNRYPAMFDKYKSFCDKGVFKPGVLWIYKAEDGKWVLNFPTKIDWRNPSEMSYIEEGLKKFVEIWKEKGITSIAFPLLGCTNGRLNPDEVIPLMEKYLNQCEGLDVTIYDNREPEIKEKPNITEDTEFFSNDENINSPKEVVIESKPLVDEEPPKPTDVEEKKEESIIQDTVEPKKEEDQNPPALLGEELPANTAKLIIQDKPLSEEEQLLKALVKEKNDVIQEVDKVLNDFVGKENTPEVRKEVTKQIINTINRRGFPAWSVFQI